MASKQPECAGERVGLVLGAFLLLQHRQRDVSGGSAVVIYLVGVMASFYALV